MSTPNNARDLSLSEANTYLNNHSTQQSPIGPLIDFLEWQYSLKEIIAVYLEKFNNTQTIWGETINISWDNFNRFLSIKEKIAYLVSLSFSDQDDAQIDIKTEAIIRCDKILEWIQEEVIYNHRFTEEQVLTNATLQHMEIPINPQEVASLTIVKNKLRSIWSFDQYISSLDQMSLAQQIIKTYQIVNISVRNNRLTDDSIIQTIEPLYNKVIDQTNVLKSGYEEMSQASNQFYKHNPFAQWLDILYDGTQKDIQEMKELLQEVWIVSNGNFNNFIQSIITENNGNVEERLNKIINENSDDLNSKVKNADAFKKLFCKYFSYHVFLQTKNKFETTKNNFFWWQGKRDKFETTIKNFTNIQRHWVIKIGEKIQNGTDLNDQEKTFLQNILKDYKRIFNSDGLGDFEKEKLFVALCLAIKNKATGQRVNLTQPNIEEFAHIIIDEANVTTALFYGKENPIEQIEENAEKLKNKSKIYRFHKMLERGRIRRQNFMKKHWIKLWKTIVAGASWLWALSILQATWLTTVWALWWSTLAFLLSLPFLAKAGIKFWKIWRQKLLDPFATKDRKWWRNIRAKPLQVINWMLKSLDVVDNATSIKKFKSIPSLVNGVRQQTQKIIKKEWVQDISDEEVKTVLDSLGSLLPIFFGNKDKLVWKTIEKLTSPYDKKKKREVLTEFLNELHAKNLDGIISQMQDLLTPNDISINIEQIPYINNSAPAPATPATPTPAPATATPAAPAAPVAAPVAAPAAPATNTHNSKIKTITHYEYIITESFSLFAQEINDLKTQIQGRGKRNIQSKLWGLKDILERDIDFDNFTQRINEIEQAILDAYQAIDSSQNSVKEEIINQGNTLWKLYALKQKFWIIWEKYNNIVWGSYTANDKSIITRTLNDIRTKLDLEKIKKN